MGEAPEVLECLEPIESSQNSYAKKVIFLDIDGVLNEHEWMQNHTPWLDENKLKLLSSVLQKTGAKVVLSSNWREVWNEPMFLENQNTGIYAGHKLFAKHNIEVVGCTRAFGKRSDEILEYVANHPEIKKYAAIDDMDIGIRNLVQTDGSVGLTEKDAEELVKILS